MPEISLFTAIESHLTEIQFTLQAKEEELECLREKLKAIKVIADQPQEHAVEIIREIVNH